MEVNLGNQITKCCTSTSLRDVNDVATTYELTNLLPPSQASHFVIIILRPLKEFLFYVFPLLLPYSH
jgi:hypothetical protein